MLHGLADHHHWLLKKGANASGFEPVALHGNPAIPSICVNQMKQWLPELYVAIAAFLSESSMHTIREPTLPKFVEISYIIINLLILSVIYNRAQRKPRPKNI